MKKVFAILAVLAMATFVFIPKVWADGTKILGSYINPISGTRLEFIQTESNNPITHNQSIIVVSATDKYGKDLNPSSLLLLSGAASEGIINGFCKGGLAGLFQAGGIITGAALVRPSGTGSGGGAIVENYNGQEQFSQNFNANSTRVYQQHLKNGR